MKVLITGGYGFIGSHVAEQFHKEGYEIFIIDNLSTGKKENVTVKHKSYILSVEDPKCKEIFASHRFDVVIHLAAQVSVSHSILQPTQDANTNIVGLIQILQLSTQTNVKKFIFASSAAVYGENEKLPLHESELPLPITPYGISKLTGEKYCEYYRKHHKLDTVCLRFSNVYGPKQTVHGEGGVISIFINNIMLKQPLVINGNGEQTRDFIYVKDVAFIIYRASQSIITGNYNVSTNTKTTINELAKTLTTDYPEIEITNTTPRNGDIHHSRLDNSLIKSQLDWSPLYTLKEGLEKTLEWANSLKTDKKIEKVEKKSKKRLPNWVMTFKPYLENVLIFFVLGSIVLSVSSPIITAFVFGLFYIVAVGSIYGSTQAFFGVILATTILIIEHQTYGRDLLSLLYDTTFLFQIATFLFIGLVVGYSFQRKNNIIAEQNEKFEDLQKRFEYSENIHSEVRDIKDELQLRVLNSEESLGKIFSIVKQLDNLEPEKIFSSTVKVVENIMRCKDVSIYMFNKNQTYLRLIARSDLSDSRYTPNSIKVEDTPYVIQLLENQKPYFNRNLTPNEPLMAAPIYYHNEIKTIITINSLSFEQFSTYHENLFVITCNLIQSSLERASKFIEVTETQRYITNTKILTANVFKEILAVKEDAQNENNLTYQLLKSTLSESALHELSVTLSPLLRETDYLGYIDNQLYALLSNTKKEDLPQILSRFTNLGYEFNVVEKVGI